MGDGNVVELKDLGGEIVGEGKNIKLETMMEAARDGCEVAGIKTTMTAKELWSFTFWQGLFLSRFKECRELIMADEVSRWATKIITADAQDNAEISKGVEAYMEPLTWLVWVGRKKLPCVTARKLPFQKMRQ